MRLPRSWCCCRRRPRACWCGGVWTSWIWSRCSRRRNERVMVWRRRIGLALLIVVAAAALIWGFRHKPQPAEVSEVARGPLQVTVEEEGKTRVSERYLVSAPVAGYLQRIALKVGDSVQRGQAVGELAPPRPAVLDARPRAEAAAGRTAEQQAAAARAEAERASVAQRRVADLCKVQCASQED